MDGLTFVRQYRGYLHRVAPDITDADIWRLRDFVPRYTSMYVAVRLALGVWHG